VYINGGPEKVTIETIDSFVVNSNFCEPLTNHVNKAWLFK